MSRAYIAHFQFRSEEDFLRRWKRGGFDNGDTMRKLFEDGTYKAVLARDDVVYDPYLAAYWWRIIAPAMRRSVQPPYGTPPFTNVAFLKPSFQSSVYAPGEHVEPAAARVVDGANSGVRTGTYGFHTAFEPTPWWSVDLLSPHRMAEIHIYNRIDNTMVLHRSAPLRIEASGDSIHWTTVLDRTGSGAFGVDGEPLVVRVRREQTFRFVRLSLTTTDYFHLDEVEIYGEPAG